MNPAKILLLDLTMADDLSNLLTNAFEPHHNCNEIHFSREKPRHSNPVFSETELAAIVSGFQPDIILLASAPDLIRQARPLFHSLRIRAETVPVLVIIDASTTEQAFDWLEL